MKEDVIAANLANLRQSISELKECIEKQNVTVSKSEQSVKVEFDEKTIYTGIAKSFCTCWNEALSVIKKHIWQQQPNTLPFSLWFPKLIDLFKQKSKLLEYLYRHVCDYNQNRITIETNTRCILKRQDFPYRLFIWQCRPKHIWRNCADKEISDWLICLWIGIKSWNLCRI